MVMEKGIDIMNVLIDFQKKPEFCTFKHLTIAKWLTHRASDCKDS
jgi:hypothetical protein